MSKMNVIRTNKHEVFTETINKIALNTNDDKKIMRDKIHILILTPLQNQIVDWLKIISYV